MNVRAGLALALVWSVVIETTENLECGVSLNTVLLAQVCLLSAVYLDKLDVLLFQGSGCLLVLGGEGLAVTTPGGEDCWGTGQRLLDSKQMLAKL